MTDNEIIKGLECCGKNPPMCSECGYKGRCNRIDCYDYLKRDALNLINRQKAEIEALIAGQETLQRYISTAKDEAVKEFAERLCKDRISNDPVVIAVKVELKMAGEENGKI